MHDHPIGAVGEFLTHPGGALVSATDGSVGQPLRRQYRREVLELVGCGDLIDRARD